jgi:hypothetical protein
MHILEAAAITNLRQPKTYDYSCLEGPAFGRRSVMRLSAAIAVVVFAVLALSAASTASEGVYYAGAFLGGHGKS